MLHFWKSLPQMFSKTNVLKFFVKFTGKCLWWGPFFNKILGLRSPTTTKKWTLAQVSSREFWEAFKNIFLLKSSGRLTTSTLWQFEKLNSLFFAEYHNMKITKPWIVHTCNDEFSNNLGFKGQLRRTWINLLIRQFSIGAKGP